MSTAARTTGTDLGDRSHNQNHTRRITTETKSSYKTTELIAFVTVLAGILIAGALIDESDAGGFGARQVWLYATILTVGYMVSRGLAKSGSREPFDDER